MNYRAVAEQIFLSGVESVLPSKLIRSHLSVKENCLITGKQVFPLDSIRNIYVIGAGKASALMAYEVEQILGDRINEGHVIVKYGHSCTLKYIDITEAGHPVPDKNGFLATEKIVKIADKAGSNDLVICLLSGGGSALLIDHPEGSSQQEIIHLNDLLVRSGASINDINAVRKHLSNVKGGQLARAACPATLVCFILSDVIGDPIDVIASGPTAPDPTTYQQAFDVLKNYCLLPLVSRGLLLYLQDGINGSRPETPKGSDVAFNKSSTVLIGTNTTALEAAKRKAIDYKLSTYIVDAQLHGEVSSVAEYIFKTSLKFADGKNSDTPVCLLFGGEPTVRPEGIGLGGRNQHLALLLALLLNNHPGITILCAGTDGNDGPTDAAGAVVDSETIQVAVTKRMDLQKFALEYNSYHFFKEAGGHIITGPTRTNVMDLVVVLIS